MTMYKQYLAYFVPFVSLYFRDDTLYHSIGSIFALGCTDSDGITDLTLVEGDSCHEYFVGFTIGCDLVFFSVSRHDPEVCLVWDLFDDLVFDPALFLYRSLEPTPLYEERLR